MFDPFSLRINIRWSRLESSKPEVNNMVEIQEGETQRRLHDIVSKEKSGRSN
jgi:hypothetical protein